MQFVTKKIRIYYNKTRFKNITLKKGNKVYLFIRNIAIKKPSKKLNYKKIRPFKIRRNIKGINFKFDLLKTIKIYPVFHALLFKPANTHRNGLVFPSGFRVGLGNGLGFGLGFAPNFHWVISGWFNQTIGESPVNPIYYK